MVGSVVGMARDWAIILLAIEALVISLVPLIALYYVTRWLRQFVPRVRPFLRRLDESVRGFSAGAKLLVLHIAAPLVWIGAAVAACRGFMHRLSSLRSGQGGRT